MIATNSRQIAGDRGYFDRQLAPQLVKTPPHPHRYCGEADQNREQNPECERRGDQRRTACGISRRRVRQQHDRCAQNQAADGAASHVRAFLDDFLGVGDVEQPLAEQARRYRPDPDEHPHQRINQPDAEQDDRRPRPVETALPLDQLQPREHASGARRCTNRCLYRHLAPTGGLAHLRRHVATPSPSNGR